MPSLALIPEEIEKNKIQALHRCSSRFNRGEEKQIATNRGGRCYQRRDGGTRRNPGAIYTRHHLNIKNVKFLLDEINVNKKERARADYRKAAQNKEIQYEPRSQSCVQELHSDAQSIRKRPQRNGQNIVLKSSQGKKYN